MRSMNKTFSEWLTSQGYQHGMLDKAFMALPNVTKIELRTRWKKRYLTGGK